MTLKARWRAFRPLVLSRLAQWVVRMLGSTWRVEVEGEENLRGHHAAIICGWHGRTIVYCYHHRSRGVWVIISHSKDGDIQASIFRNLGYRVIRGSTGRGGVRAAVEGIRSLRAGGLLAITPDGPRGPLGVAQGGMMMIAQKSGAVLVPAATSAKNRIVLKSWDRFMVPLPFSRAILLFGSPIRVPEDADEATLEAIRLQVQTEMHRLQDEAELRMGHGAAQAESPAREVV